MSRGQRHLKTILRYDSPVTSTICLTLPQAPEYLRTLGYQCQTFVFLLLPFSIFQSCSMPCSRLILSLDMLIISFSFLKSFPYLTKSHLYFQFLLGLIIFILQHLVSQIITVHGCNRRQWGCWLLYDGIEHHNSH